ncbi:MAG: extracellular solute-binding protein [Chloroflexi bacterium]|nr:MAG: extracellular solute-binding protein [Chloroflexota bacterium]
MEDITFSIFNHGPVASARMQALLKQFEQEEKIRVRLEMIPWTMGWSRMVEVALYHIGPDVSEIGSTWVMDFVRTDALRPYSPTEMNYISDGKRYFESCVAGGVSLGQNPTTWAMPLAGDARVIFYRRDLLQQAGVDEASAFASPAQFEGTLARLKAQGLPTPLALPTQRSRNSLHSLAAWVWGAGGNFLSADGVHVEFDAPRALDGFKSFFALGPYLGKTRLDEYDSDGLFLNGKAATTISGYWLLHETQAAEVSANLGVASVPGIPFVGGEHLVIWRHARNPQAALKLVKFISRAKSGESVYPQIGLPPSPDGWQRPPFDQPGYGVLLQAMHSGRAFPTSPLWGLVEKRLIDVMPEIWNDVLARPEKAEKTVETEIGSLAQRLRMTLKA